MFNFELVSKVIHIFEKLQDLLNQKVKTSKIIEILKNEYNLNSDFSYCIAFGRINSGMLLSQKIMINLGKHDENYVLIPYDTLDNYVNTGIELSKKYQHAPYKLLQYLDLCEIDYKIARETMDYQYEYIEKIKTVKEVFAVELLYEFSINSVGELFKDAKRNF